MKLTIDVHSHLLPGVDDGFKKVDQSTDALKLLAKSGCKTLFLTPHLNPDVYPDNNEKSMRTAYSHFISSIPEQFPIQILLAAEYMLVRGFEEKISDNLLCFPNKTVLIEMSYYFLSENLEQAVFNLNMAGYKPMLAHPERYLYMVDSMGTFERLKDMGCKFQMNALSLTGLYGKSSMAILDYLIDKKWYNAIGSDIHSVDHLEKILNTKVKRRYAREIEYLLENNQKLLERVSPI